MRTYSGVVGTNGFTLKPTTCHFGFTPGGARLIRGKRVGSFVCMVPCRALSTANVRCNHSRSCGSVGGLTPDCCNATVSGSNNTCVAMAPRTTTHFGLRNSRHGAVILRNAMRMCSPRALLPASRVYGSHGNGPLILRAGVGLIGRDSRLSTKSGIRN